MPEGSVDYIVVLGKLVWELIVQIILQFVRRRQLLPYTFHKLSVSRSGVSVVQ